MLNWKCAHTQLEACTCSTGSVHLLNWDVCVLKLKCAHAQLACTCSPESVCMLNWKRAHAHVTLCTCSSGVVHVLNWKHAHSQLEACACATGSVHLLNWNVCMLKCKCAYAQLAYTLSVTPESVCMHNWKRVHAQLEVCTCATGSVHMLNWEHEHEQLEVCTCSIGMCTC